MKHLAIAIWLVGYAAVNAWFRSKSYDRAVVTKEEFSPGVIVVSLLIYVMIWVGGAMFLAGLP